MQELGETVSNVPRFLDSNPFRTHGLGNLREIRILEFHAERIDPGLLLFNMDEVELLVVENDLNHRSFSLDLGQQITHSQRGEPPSPRRDTLPPWIHRRRLPNAF